MAHKIRPLWAGFTYFQHQLDGINWMLDKEISGTEVPNRGDKGTVLVRGGFQCDDMGLGKTIQITSVIINNPKPFTILIAPLAMIDTWSEVLQKAGCLVYETNKVTKKNINPWKLMNDPSAGIRRMKIRPTVYISNYEKLYHTPALFRRSWDRVVLDEAHKIRNGDGDAARYARRLDAPIRWAVTGTPLVNSLKDVVSLLAFVGVPYSKLWRWEPRYLRILPHIVIHRSLDSLRSVIKGAPPIPKIKTVLLPFKSKAEEDFYFGIQGATEELMKRFAKDKMNSAQAFTLLLRLRQISVHPQVYINAKRREDEGYNCDNWGPSSTKLEKIKEIIERDRFDGEVHKYIIFCQFNDEMALIRNFLFKEYLVRDDCILQYSGSMTQLQRGEVLRKSKETKETTVMLIQLQSGGVGLNLQEYDRIIFVSPWWTSALMDQAIARAVRMGQTRVVKVWHLHLAAEHETAVNIDELINAKAEEKRAMLKKLFDMCSKGISVDGVDEEVLD